MKLSTRNQLAGTVTSVTTGEAMAVIKSKLDDGPEITSSITRDAAEARLAPDVERSLVPR